MINRLQLLRNIGKFDSVSGAANIPLAKLTVVYSENGRGKTTLAAVLRSLATGDPLPIAERRRLAAQNPPHVVLECSGGPPPAMFQDNAWNRTLPDIVVFDDVFIDRNVHSGLAVGAHHRQNLHELILGAQAVTLNRRLQELVAQIEVHNTALRVKAASIPATDRGSITVDEFCALPARDDINEAILEGERNLAAALEQETVRNAQALESLSLPAFDLLTTQRVLQQDLPALSAATLARVQSHLATLGAGGEPWVGDGMHRVTRSTQAAVATCPFCAQDLQASPVIQHYRAYFSEGYAALKREVGAALTEVARTHSGDVPAGFERAVRVLGERRQFWSRFCDVPELTLDTAAVVRDWTAARQAVVAQLTAKQAAPLERTDVSEETRTLIAAFEARREDIRHINQLVHNTNHAIGVVKERLATANVTVLRGDLLRLKAIKARHDPPIAALCDDYVRERDAKGVTERERDQAKAALETHRTTVFPGYQTAINVYLQRFNVGFRLGNVISTDTRGGPTCTYNVIINNTPVAVSGNEPTPGEPSFRNTLSGGDRNTLALAFFFASLDQDPSLATRVVVIDDPISSLDEHRALTTVQEIRRLTERACQVIVLSHNKAFLLRLWEGADPTPRAALEVARDGAGSTVRVWNVADASLDEHDRRHARLRDYLAMGIGDQREVARSIRPHLERFLRTGCPERFPPGTLLGPFLHVCEQRLGLPDEVLDGARTQELRDLVDYSNRFHHDTNPAWETEAINDGELQGFVRRALAFTRP